MRLRENKLTWFGSLIELTQDNIHHVNHQSKINNGYLK